MQYLRPDAIAQVRTITYGLRQTDGPLMSSRVFRLEPSLGNDLLLVERSSGKICNRAPLTDLFAVLAQSKKDAIYCPLPAIELQFDPSRPVAERVYWSEQDNVVADIIQFMTRR